VTRLVSSPIFVFDSRERWFPVGVEESIAATSPSGGLGPPVTLNFPAGMTQPDLPPVVYRRSVVGGPLTWVQWWLWYLYNPKAYAGVGKHEGDWEFCQIGVVPPAASLLMTCSQHHSGGKRFSWDVQRKADDPVVYVALGSHAMYFTPERSMQDECDGQGLALHPGEYEEREFGEWASAPGRWGNSRGEGMSPLSPGLQGRRWAAPHLFHSAARDG
jgi:hypothetical protein